MVSNAALYLTASVEGSTSSSPSADFEIATGVITGTHGLIHTEVRRTTSKQSAMSRTPGAPELVAVLSIISAAGDLSLEGSTTKAKGVSAHGIGYLLSDAYNVIRAI